MSNFNPIGPSSQDISEMQKLINMMNGVEDSTPAPQPQAAPTRAAPTASPQVVSSDKDAMKAILESFNAAAGDALYETVEEAKKYDPRLLEAIQTKRTDEGAIIGAWEVRVKLTETLGAERKMYDVMHPGTKEVLFQDLVVFEAAHAIVRYLNKGLVTTHPKITEIADLEEIYRRNRQDAVIFKKRYQRCVELKEMAAGEVFEARYHKARAQAIVANDSIRTILENIR